MLNQKDQMHPEDRRNMLMFAVAALLVWFGYEHFFIQPRMEKIQQAYKQEQALKDSGYVDTTALKTPRDAVLARSQRVAIENPLLKGSIALTGGRLDDLELLNYSKKLNEPARVDLLSPPESDYPLYIDFGWMPDGPAKTVLPDAKTQWREASPGAVLKPGAPVTLVWDNGHGLKFEREYAIDDQYMFTVAQRVTNTSASPVTLYPYAAIAQQGLPEEFSGRRMHEGPVGYLDGKLTEIQYLKMKKGFDDLNIAASSGWIGMSEEYWFTGVIPAAGEKIQYSFRHVPPPTREGRDRFQVDAVGSARTLAPGETAKTETRVFTGAKEVKKLEAYERSLSIPHFDLAVDFGLYYFMTKPLFHILHYFYSMVGNMGLAIIMLTCLVRLLVFPLANISYRSFARLRQVAPQMKEIRERCGNDKTKLQQELVALYDKEKVNPMAGCLPMIVQIPIFFALYKVMIITIELRHAPFFGWIHDLSAPDPTTVFNLFGLIPWDPPHALMIGAWPLMMLGTQLIQRNMNPPPQDKMQAYMINIMPFFFCYIMAGFASGLVVYWTFSGALGVLQQYILMRSMGVEVHLFRRTKEEQELEKKVMEQPSVHPGLEKLEEDIEQAVTGDVAPSEPKPKKKKT